MGIKIFPKLPLLTISLLLLSISSTSSSSSDIHDLLPNYGFPKGLIPNAVVSYTLSPGGHFSVRLSRPCYVLFDDQLVYYDTDIRGDLQFGSVRGVSGIQAKRFFVWVSVTGMTLDTGSGMIEFHVGPLSKKLPAKDFDSIPDCCKNKDCPSPHYHYHPAKTYIADT